MKILLVEDDLRFAAALAAALQRGGYDVERVRDGRSALTAVGHELVLLGMEMPDNNGLRLCSALRALGDTGVIVLSARGEERHRIAGLRAGADDYLVKPFGIAELEARIEAVLRRVRPKPRGVLTVGALSVDLDRREVWCAAERVELTHKEFDLLALLAATPGRVQRRERLYLEVWNTSWHGTSRTLDVHMGTLRAKVADGVRIETVRGVGYRLVSVTAASLSA